MNSTRKKAVEQAITTLRALASGAAQNEALDKLLKAFRDELGGGVTTQDEIPDPNGSGGHAPTPPPPPPPK